MKKLQEHIEANNIWFFTMLRLLDDGTLIIIGSLDLGYYHDVEIRFKGTQYISCPYSFCEAKFRLATDEEREKLKPKLMGGIDDIIICIIIDEDFEEKPVKHFIVAEEIEINTEHVGYHKQGEI